MRKHALGYYRLFLRCSSDSLRVSAIGIRGSLLLVLPLSENQPMSYSEVESGYPRRSSVELYNCSADSDPPTLFPEDGGDYWFEFANSRYKQRIKIKVMIASNLLAPFQPFFEGGQS